MSKYQDKKPHILFLFSDTGGGHRSAAEAIIEALHLEYDGKISTEMVDIFKDHAPLPLNRFPDWYPYMVRIPQIWGLGFRLSDGHPQARFIMDSSWPYLRSTIRKLIDSHPCDLIVSVHPLASTPILRALGQKHPPFITVVTDLVSTHALWYERRTDLCLVATETAFQRALRYHLRPEQVRVVGLPVANRFCLPSHDQRELRKQLNWPAELPMILLIGGGEGMGPLDKTARAIAEARLPAGMAIVTGRNLKLKTRLEAESWPEATFIYGFTRNMPEMMGAANILVTKAGPGTISEALNAGLPMILYSRLPGQEDGNITYVTEEGAGVWAPQPDQVVAKLWEWLNRPEKLAQAGAACRRLARPQAARMIAHILAQEAGLA
jgi:1,2-diacylglycerol 3-beta-galactosyltransferase